VAVTFQRSSGKLARAWAPGAVTCLILLGSATGALGAATVAAPTSSLSSVPRPGSSSELSGISCTSPGDCWAVGDFTSASGAQLNQALHWNGRKWSLVPTPSPGGTQHGASSQLSGVACPLPASCWAVGDYHTSGNSLTFLNQALHWNGRKWSLVPTPEPGLMAQRAFDSLVGVRCISASNCWAVGSFTNPGNGLFELNQALHWNGRRWSLVATPDPGSSSKGALDGLSAVRCTSAGNCWAVGIFVQPVGTGESEALLNQALHWNGRRWSQASTPDPGGAGATASNGLNAVACTSSGNCWAIGSYGTFFATPQTSLNQALRWNGRQWSQVFTPNPDGIAAGAGNELIDVTCTSPVSCWAVGDYGRITRSLGVRVNQALHWNGRHWSLVPTPDPGGLGNDDSSGLTAIRCPSPASCWAVGVVSTKGQANLNEILHWNGASWSVG
jgi:hypothetical protein